MTDVFHERQFDPPLTPSRVGGWQQRAAGALRLYNVDWRGSYLANDGKRMVCWFSAPDAELPRTALRQLGAEVSTLWPGTVHEGRADSAGLAANVLVQRSFESAVTFEEIQALETAGAHCLQTHGASFVRTFFARDRRRMACLYRAPDAKSVRQAQRQAGMRFDRVWAFDRVTP